MSLSDDDNDPLHYLTYLVAVLQTRQAGLGETVLTLINTPQPPPLNTLLTLLLNELSALPTPLALVLDDYHLITVQAVQEAMTFFINHLPPHIHLVITTRIDPPLPLARWRARNQLLEIRADELRFSPGDVTGFLNGVMRLQLTAAQIATLETHTEGWSAGLQFVAAGLSYSQIAAQLIVTTGTIKTHINHIFGKLGAQSRTQAVARARMLGLVTD